MSRPLTALAAAIPRRAWTGGSAPRKFLQCCELERTLRRQLFREQSRMYADYWGDLPLDVARIFYGRAAADAHATVRPMTES
jgi:hypothetical protein